VQRTQRTRHKKVRRCNLQYLLLNIDYPPQ
jgi:hypothetical protein